MGVFRLCSLPLIEYTLVLLYGPAHILVVRRVVIIFLETVGSDTALVAARRHIGCLPKQLAPNGGKLLEILREDELVGIRDIVVEIVHSAIGLQDEVVDVFRTVVIEYADLPIHTQEFVPGAFRICLLYTSDAADEL